MRAFLAIPVLSAALEGFLALQARLDAAVGSVCWAATESPHLTLHFFGEVGGHDLERALAVLAPVAAAHPSMRLALRRLGAFPSAGRPRILWWGVAGDLEALTLLAQACRSALAAEGFTVDERPYVAHCTLGRPQQPWPPQSLQRWAALVATEPHSATFAADRAVLYESLTGPAGTRHVPRVTLPLGS